MLSGMLPVSAFAAGEEDAAYVNAEVSVSEEMADALVNSLFGAGMGDAVKTDKGYQYKIPADVVAELAQSIEDETGTKLTVPDETDAEDNDASETDEKDSDASKTDAEDSDASEMDEKDSDASKTDAEDSDASKDADVTENVNELPADYVDNSNDGINEMLEEMASMPAAAAYSSSSTKVDLVFVIDSTGSMSPYITNVKNNVAEFARAIGESGVTLRLGLIDYRDITSDGIDSTKVHEPGYSPWMQVSEFIKELTTVGAYGGGDEPETPIDGLGNLVKSDAGWSSDAYKFVMLITDASFKDDNTHGIANMEEMIRLLREKGIQVSTITPERVLELYGDLAGMTGGVQIPLSDNFADDMMEYADKVISSSEGEKRDYTLRVADDATGLPVAGAVVSWSGGSTTTDSDGIATITSNERPIRNVTVEKGGYILERIDELYNDVDVYMAKMKLDEDAVDVGVDGTDSDTDDIPVLNASMFKNPKSGSGKSNPVSLEFLGKEFNLLDGLNFSFDLKVFDKGKLTISNDIDEKTFKVLFGYDWTGEDPPDKDSSYWKEDYKKYKSLVQKFSKKDAKTIYNDFRKLRASEKARTKTNTKADIMFPVDVNCGGYAEVSYASGELAFSEGGIVIGISTKELTLLDLPFPPAPFIYFRLTFQMDAKGELKLTVESTAKALIKPSATVTLNPKLTGMLNLGVPKLASVGGGLTGSLDATMNIPFAKLEDGLTVKLTGNFTVKLKLLGFEKGKDFEPFGELQLYPPKKGGKAAVYSLASISADEFTMIGRPTAIGARSGGFDYQKDAVYEDSAPQLALLDDGTMVLVWVDAVDSRDESNMTALYYSVKKPSDATWSEPRMVDNDGTGDHMPVLTLSASGTPVVVWQDNKTAWTSEPTLEAQAADIDLAAAVYDTTTDSFGTAAQITTGNTKYETAVQLAQEGTGVAAYWIESTAENLLLDDGNVSICKSSWDGTSWATNSKVADVTLPEGGMNGFAAGTVNGTPYVAYAEGNTIHYYANGTSTPGTITTTDSSSSLQIVDGLMYWRDSEGLKNWNGSTTTKENIKSVPDEFIILTNSTYGRMLLSRQSTGLANELYASVCTKGSSEWGNPVPVTDYDMSLSAPSAVLDNTGKLYWASGRTEINNAESPAVRSIDDVFGGSDLVVSSCTPAANVVVGEDAQISDIDVIPGKEVYVSVELENQGLADASGLTAELTLDGGATQTSDLYVIDESDTTSESVLTSVKAGESVWADAKYTLPATLTGGKLTVDIKQSGVSVGTATATIPGAAPDLAVENVTAARTESGATITADVKNNGYADASNVTVTLEQEGIDSDDAATQTISLTKGASQNVTFTVDKERLNAESIYDYKKFTVTAKVDGEVLEGDNSASAVLEPVKVTGISLEGESELAMKGGETKQLTCTVTPTGAPASLTWMSTNTSVVTVDNTGKVSAWGDGTADIIVSAETGETDESGSTTESTLRDKVTITVTEGISTAVSSVAISPSSSSLAIGDTLTLRANITPGNALNKKVEWHIADESKSIIEITDETDDSIVIKGLAEGTAVVTVVTDDGGYTNTANITVTKKTVTDTPDTPSTSVTTPTTGSSGGSSGGSGGNSSASTYFGASISKTENGSVSVSPATAKKGSTVIITVRPKNNYKLDTLVVKDAKGNEIETEKVSDNKYTFTMPGSKVDITPSFTASGDSEDKTDSKADISFTDVAAGAYYADAVRWAVGKGITNGTTSTTFSPNASCTRAQMVTFLWRAAGSPLPSSNSSNFTDIKSGEYYYNAVLWAVENGITTGTSATTFSPNKTVTRGQTVTFLYRKDNADKVNTANPFSDVANGKYYTDAVMWAVSNGITNGTTATTFSPDNNCTRGQIVTFIYRYMGK